MARWKKGRDATTRPSSPARSRREQEMTSSRLCIARHRLEPTVLQFAVVVIVSETKHSFHFGWWRAMTDGSQLYAVAIEHSVAHSQRTWKLEVDAVWLWHFLKRSMANFVTQCRQHLVFSTIWLTSISWDAQPIEEYTTDKWSRFFFVLFSFNEKKIEV